MSFPCTPKKTPLVCPPEPKHRGALRVSDWDTDSDEEEINNNNKAFNTPSRKRQRVECPGAPLRPGEKGRQGDDSSEDEEEL